jgi:hypothetical protein
MLHIRWGYSFEPITLKNMRDPVEDNLRAEIDFWRSMISKCERTNDERAYARIREALALAEYKLARHLDGYSGIRLH